MTPQSIINQAKWFGYPYAFLLERVGQVWVFVPQRHMMTKSNAYDDFSGWVDENRPAGVLVEVRYERDLNQVVADEIAKAEAVAFRKGYDEAFEAQRLRNRVWRRVAGVLDRFS